VFIGLVIGVLLLGIGLGYALCRKFRHAAAEAGQALLAATEAGDVARMQTLLARRVDIEARDAQGLTPLHVAAAGGDIAVVRLLVQHGADVNAQSYIGATPLDHAMTYGRRHDVVELLQAYGARGNTDWGAIF
jgi:ankyrin repeat protein